MNTIVILNRLSLRKPHREARWAARTAKSGRTVGEAKGARGGFWRSPRGLVQASRIRGAGLVPGRFRSQPALQCRPIRFPPRTISKPGRFWSQDDFEASLRCSAADGALQGLAGVFGRLPYGRSSKTWGRGIRLEGSRRETLTRPPSAPGRPVGGFGSVLVDDAEELVRPIRLEGAVKVHP